MKFSVILPVYNEAARVPVLARSYGSTLDGLGYTWELLLVVNGSRDDSYAAACREAARDPRVRAFELVEPQSERRVELVALAGEASQRPRQVTQRQSVQSLVSPPAHRRVESVVRVGSEIDRLVDADRMERRGARCSRRRRPVQPAGTQIAHP